MMIKDATGDCYWSYDDLDEYRLFFVGRVDSGSYEVVLTFRAFEQDKFLAMAVIIGERQHLWAEWQEIAEQSGADCLCEHVFSLHGKDYLENFLDVEISEARLKVQGVTVSVQLPYRRVDLLRHRFQTSELQAAFMAWANASDLERLVRLCLVCLLQGRQALAKKMDEIASAELANATRIKHVVVDFAPLDVPAYYLD